MRKNKFACAWFMATAIAFGVSSAQASESVQGTVTRLQSYISPDGSINGIMVRTSAGMPSVPGFDNCGSSGSFILDKNHDLFNEIYSFLLTAFSTNEEVKLDVGNCLGGWPKVNGFTAGDI